MIDQLNIRLFRREDGAALADVHRRAILSTRHGAYSGEDLESWAYGLRDDGYADSILLGELIEVAVDESNVPVAFCARTDTEILAIYTHPEAQRRGIGTGLLARAEIALGEPGVEISRVRSSLGAENFYLRNGYVREDVGIWTTRGGRSLDVLHMIKPLADVPHV